MNNTAESRIVASFTFITALILGAWGPLEVLIAGPLPYAVTAEAGGRLIMALVPIAATAVAWQASNATAQVWARTLGGAAVMLGILSSVAALLYIIAGV